MTSFFKYQQSNPNNHTLCPNAAQCHIHRAHYIMTFLPKKLKQCPQCKIETQCGGLQNIKTHNLIENSPKTTYKMVKQRNVIVF